VAARSAAPDLSIAIIDRARFPRDKLCGGAITGGGLRELELAGLELRVVHVPVSEVELRVDGRRVRGRLPRPAAVVRRREWDADLVNQARARGVTVLEEAPLLGLSEEVADTGAGPIAFRALVCADGSAGPSRRLLGLQPGVRAPLREAWVPGEGAARLVFDLDAAGVQGYAWRFPSRAEDGSLLENCGIYAAELEPGFDLSRALAGWAKSEGLAVEGQPEAWALRLAEPGGPVGQGRALLCGDALGADPLAGEGIRYALWSGRIAGRLAGQALHRGKRPSLRRYRRRLALSRSGVTLWLFVHLARRIHRLAPRPGDWRGMALDRAVVAGLASAISGAPLFTTGAALLWRYALLRGGVGRSGRQPSTRELDG
jgi:flavin-dependent dehydrogenase